MKRLRQYVREQSEKHAAFAASLEQARAEVRLAVAVAQLREQRGMSQRDLARETGIKQPQIARVEKGGHLPTLDTLWRLLTALEACVEIGPHGRFAVRSLSQQASRRSRHRGRSTRSTASAAAR